MNVFPLSPARPNLAAMLKKKQLIGVVVGWEGVYFGSSKRVGSNNTVTITMIRMIIVIIVTPTFSPAPSTPPPVPPFGRCPSRFLHDSHCCYSTNCSFYVLMFVSSWHVAVQVFRRAPDSFTDLRYYSWMAYDFKAKDGVRRYARFRILPADGRPESGLLSEQEQKKVW